MKNITRLSLILLSVFSVATAATAQTQARKKPAVAAKGALPAKRVVGKMVNPGRKVYTQSTDSKMRGLISAALGQMKSGQYIAAANNLLALSRRSELSSERPQIKYLLGLAFMELNLNQVAAFQFVDVIKSADGRYTRQAIEKLLVVTDRLGDETLLNYAIQRIDVASVPTQNRDMLYYRMAEIKQKSGAYAEAAQLYARVGPQSRYYLNALYGSGLAQAEAQQTDLALGSFRKLLNTRSGAKVTDTNKVSAQMAIARTLYQKKDWEGSIEAYSRIPRDHVMWHDAIFEQSWAMLRAARFRSALSNFQSLHSSYYDDFYIPETLLLRSIVYLYICKYDEMEKVLSLYDKQYGPVQKSIDSFLANRSYSEQYYQEIEKAAVMKGSGKVYRTALPYKVLKRIAEEGDVRRALGYIRRLGDERKLVEENPQIKSSAIGAYSMKVLQNRAKSAKSLTGDMAKAHLQNMQVELKDLQEQSSLIRYEMINGKKESIKKRMTGKDLAEVQVDETKDRSFYVQNGYEYYPFQGEYWLDEVGNYHYLGKQNCE